MVYYLIFFVYFFCLFTKYSSTRVTGNPAVAFALKGVGKGELGQACHYFLNCLEVHRKHKPPT